MITAICLCLDKREELWRNLKEQCIENNIQFISFICGDGSKDLIYNQIDSSLPIGLKWGYGNPFHIYNHYNAFRAHRAMAKIGLSILESNPERKILFLEDDARILDRIKLINKIDIQDDITYLGYWLGRETDISIENEYQANGEVKLEEVTGLLGGLHGAILNSRALETIISMKPNDPVDAQLNRSTLKRWIVKPKLISTVNTYSFTEGVIIERDYL